MSTGFVFEELYLWHNAGSITYGRQWVEQGEVWENPDTKRRFHSLLAASGYLAHLTPIPARHATEEEILVFHTRPYLERIRAQSALEGGNAGDMAQFSKGSYEIATLSAGGVLSAVEAVMEERVKNSYCLVRPPGHHAVADQGMGFCIFNNIVIAAHRARALGCPKIAIIDYDVHHGNGTQEAFWSDPNTLFISVHQDSNYPLHSGYAHETGHPELAPLTTINVPLPPGSGTGAYYYAFDKVVLPAVARFQPDFILVSSGFDASYADPLGAMMLSSEAFANITSKILAVAEVVCQGRCVFAHEGGYSKEYVPFCGLAVLESLSGIKSGVVDPSLDEVRNWGYQELQSHQAKVVDAVAERLGLLASVDGNNEANDEVAVLERMETLLRGLPVDSRRAVLAKLSKDFL